MAFRQLCYAIVFLLSLILLLKDVDDLLEFKETAFKYIAREFHIHALQCVNRRKLRAWTYADTS